MSPCRRGRGRVVGLGRPGLLRAFQSVDKTEVADSIARHGFFESEPLIALRTDEPNRYIVLEGNRRLAALKALADPSVRQVMTKRRWADIPAEVDLPNDLPVLVVEEREQVAPILGFRHVTGITPWDPFQQAQYVASMIDGERQLDASTVAELIGRSVSEVRSFYRNYSIVEQANDEFDLPDTKRIVDEFGVWTRAMTSSGIRDYIGAPAPRDVIEREYPLESQFAEQLERVITWIFGVPRSDEEKAEGKQSREGRAIDDSRQLSRLGAVLAHPAGRTALEAKADLETAERSTLDERTLFADALEEAETALELATKHRPKRMTKTVTSALDRLADALRRLRDGD